MNANDELEYITKIAEALQTIHNYNITEDKDGNAPDFSLPYPDQAWDDYYNLRMKLAEYWILDYHQTDCKDEYSRNIPLERVTKTLCGTLTKEDV
jgi:hypothetical protein